MTHTTIQKCFSRIRYKLGEATFKRTATVVGLVQLHTLVVEAVIVCGCLSLLSSRCVAQDDVVIVSYMLSKEKRSGAERATRYTATRSSTSSTHKVK